MFTDVRRLLEWVAAAIRTGGALRDDRGEGVISAAIAVLIMAFLGALMWASFQVMWQNTEDNTNRHISTMTSE